MEISLLDPKLYFEVQTYKNELCLCSIEDRSIPILFNGLEYNNMKDIEIPNMFIVNNTTYFIIHNEKIGKIFIGKLVKLNLIDIIITIKTKSPRVSQCHDGICKYVYFFLYFDYVKVFFDEKIKINIPVRFCHPYDNIENYNIVIEIGEKIEYAFVKL